MKKNKGIYFILVPCYGKPSIPFILGFSFFKDSP